MDTLMSLRAWRLVAGLALVAGTWFGAATTATATPVSYRYDDTCVSNCANVGLSNGAAITGTVTFDDTNFAPNANIRETDVLSFEINFGSATISSATAVGLFFEALLESDGETFQNFVSLITSNALDPGQDATIFQVVGAPLLYSLDGGCLGTCGNGVNTNTTANARGITLTRLTDVPEPATLALFAGGLAFGGLLRGRRRSA